ncbi:MAG: hypothetical protein GY822_03095 [Deltaproteobacteria bacterium]|nr:hypothetical protein [Deltaproteobacteria bacterium]
MGMTHDPRLQKEPTKANSAFYDVITFLGVFGGITFIILLGLAVIGATEIAKASTAIPMGFAVAAFVVWAFSSYEKVKKKLSVRSGSYFFVAFAQLLVALGLLTALLYYFEKNPKQWDLSESSVHSLSQMSAGVVKSVQRPVRVIAFFERGTAEAESISRTANMFALVSPMVTFSLKSPSTDLADVEKYKVTEQGPRVIVETDWHDEKLRRDSRFKMLAADLDIEERLVNAFIDATQKKRPLIGVLLGHSERSIRGRGDEGLSDIKSDLLAEGYNVIPLNLRLTSAVPDNVSMILLAGPQNDLLPPEQKAIATFLQEGGRLLCMLEPGGATLDSLLAPFGVMPNKDLILDVSKFGRMFGSGPDTATISDYGRHPIVDGLNNATTLFQRSVSMSIMPGDVKPVSLALTHEDTWGETDMESLKTGSARWDQGEGHGPLTLAAAVSLPVAEDVEGKRNSEARVVVVGDSNFITNKFRRLGGNRDFLLNITAWLSSNEERISIRSNRRGTSLIVLTESQRNSVVLTLVVFFPSLLFALGFTIWRRRRSR